MKNIFPTLLITTLLLSSCSDNMELSKSVFIDDLDYPGLPKYTEWGYNTFGVYYDRKSFVSNDTEVPVKILVANGATRFIFRGQESSQGYYGGYGYGKMSMTIRIPNFSPSVVTDLLVLNDTTLLLDDPGFELELEMDGTPIQPQVLNGRIHFTRVQNLVVDTQQTEVILSGTFEFQVVIDGEPIAFSDGRFDLGISYSNFFVF